MKIAITIFISHISQVGWSHPKWNLWLAVINEHHNKHNETDRTCKNEYVCFKRYTVAGEGGDLMK